MLCRAAEPTGIAIAVAVQIDAVKAGNEQTFEIKKKGWSITSPPNRRYYA
jgi:hypothetical protein